MSDFDEYIKNKYPSDYLLMTVRYPDQELSELYPDQFEVWQHQQAKIDEYYETGVALNTETINQRRYILSQSNKINELQKRVDVALQVIFDCRAIGADRIYVCDAVEKTLRGEHE